MKNGSENEVMWTAKEAASYLRININSLYVMVRKKEGGPPAYRIANLLRFPRSKFIAWTEKQAYHNAPMREPRPRKKDLQCSA